MSQPTVQAPSRTRVRAALATLNIALVGVVVAVALSPSHAGAQATATNAARARGEYTMVAGEISAGSNAVTYIVDSANQEVLVVRWDQSRAQLQSIGYRNLAADAVAAPVR